MVMEKFCGETALTCPNEALHFPQQRQTVQVAIFDTEIHVATGRSEDYVVAFETSRARRV